MAADKPTELSRIKLKFELDSPSVWSASIQSTQPHSRFGIRTWLWRYTYIRTSIHTYIHFLTLTQHGCITHYMPSRELNKSIMQNWTKTKLVSEWHQHCPLLHVFNVRYLLPCAIKFKFEFKSVYWQTGIHSVVHSRWSITYRYTYILRNTFLFCRDDENGSKIDTPWLCYVRL